MLDEKTNKLLEKIAQQDATGMSQFKQRKTKYTQDHAGAGTGLGALIGAGAGALSKKYKPISAAAGAILGALAGKELGKRTKTKQLNVTQEGVIKKQQKDKSPGAKPSVPKLDDAKILRLLNDKR